MLFLVALFYPVCLCIFVELRLHDFAPIYLQKLIKKYQPFRNLRSSTQSRLTCPSTSTQYGQRSFSVAASELWNSLPLHVNNSKTIVPFKSSPKTY